MNDRPGGIRPAASVWAAALLLACATMLVNAPGVQGGFLLDDAANLTRLTQFGPVQDWDSLLLALSSGSAGPTGRPVALLSFLLNSTATPESAIAYKITNVALHAVNALVLFWLLILLSRAFHPEPQRVIGVALFGAAFWAMHPLWVSTTLYVVQRMALLATTFSLLTFLLFVQGRLLVAQGESRRGVLRICTGLGVFGPLALLSKENAGLLPLQLLVFEVFLFSAPAYRRRFPDSTSYRWLFWLALVLPGLMLLGWLLYRWPLGDAKTLRNWGVSMLERAFIGTQMLFDYLRLLALPTDETRGLFYDDIRPANGWLEPWRILLSSGALAGMMGAAWWLRRRFAIAGFALAFFLVGHLMETWLVALEFGFEHRNYLPALFLFWPLVWLMDRPALRALMRGRGVVLLCGAMLFLLAALTISRSTLWGNTTLLASVWAQTNPNSERAHAFYTEQLLKDGRPAQALAQLELGYRQLPGSAVLAVAGLHLGCPFGQVEHWKARVMANIAGQRLHMEHYHKLLERIAFGIATQKCRHLRYEDLLGIARRIQSHPNFRSTPGRERIHHVTGLIHLLRGQTDLAMEAYRSALDIRPLLGGAMNGAVHLRSAGYPDLALQLLAEWEARGAHLGVRSRGLVAALTIRQRKEMMRRELARLRQALREDAAAGSGSQAGARPAAEDG